jgi:hypothetical protein
MDHHFTMDYIIRRIEHAGATLYCMRIKNPRPLLAQGRLDIIRGYMDDMPPASPSMRLPTPSARDVTLMDEALDWIRLVPNSTSRRLISLRSQFHPLTERTRHSWRACGKVLGIDHKTAESWHRKAIGLLSVALLETEIRSPVGCNVVPDHIHLRWLEAESRAMIGQRLTEVN